MEATIEDNATAGQQHDIVHKPVKLSRDGLPVDGRDWTQEDWRDLHNAIETAKTAIRGRHTKGCENAVAGQHVSRQTKFHDASTIVTGND